MNAFVDSNACYCCGDFSCSNPPTTHNLSPITNPLALGGRRWKRRGSNPVGLRLQLRFGLCLHRYHFVARLSPLARTARTRRKQKSKKFHAIFSNFYFSRDFSCSDLHYSFVLYLCRGFSCSNLHGYDCTCGFQRILL